MNAFYRISSSIAALAMCAASQATAQTSTSEEPAEARSTDGSGEIIVTAQRRSERLLDVPASVTALTADQLEASGVMSTDRLTNATPGLLWGRSSSNSQPTIRGIGSRNAAAGDEPNVATFIDGVYQPEQSGTLLELANIERVEVLKGPQGTLFGRNATGGAINIVTRAPSDTLSAAFDLSYGSYNYRKASAYVSGGLIENVWSASLSALTLGDDGYVDNIFLGIKAARRKAEVVRFKNTFKLGDAVEVQLNGLYNHAFDNVAYSGFPLGGNSSVRRAPASQNPNNLPLSLLIPSGPYTTSVPFEPYYKVTQYLVDGHISYDMGFATLAGLASYGVTNGFQHSASDLSPLGLSVNDFNQRGRAYNQEVTLTSNGDDTFQWLIGGSAFQGRTIYDPLTSTTPTSVTRLRYGQRTRSAAVFAEATYQLVDDLFVTGGLRYTQDTKQSINQPLATNVLTTSERTWKQLSPRAVVRYEFAQDSNVYASYTNGFKSGTFNPTTLNGTLIPAQPEKIDAFEVGIKTRPVPGVNVTAAAFHYRYKDLQVAVIQTINGLITSLTENANEATIDGFELSADAKVTDGLRLRGSVSLLRPIVTDFTNASVNVPIITNGLPSGNSSAGPRDVSGNDLIRAPRRTLMLGFTYDVPLGSSKLSINGDAFFSDKFFVELTNRVTQPAYEIVNGSISWTSEDERLKLSVFGQNLTNQKVFAAAIVTTLNDNVVYQKPRWFGVSLGFRY
jgi:iron complex outermembrane receptor protein